ncbi:pantothenate synthase [Zygosaccharomyces mellis]|uniref:Pantoate--beta-alanine ligase n=1 Tax=Zygosaccharomyces mellis TaxID=42258 RepID=A0A4C2EDK6_9SACH|nr:pantothenate synthase [Zygosaccharomyces mellis]
MITVTSVGQLKEYRDSLEGSVGFVPTMGALHEGHLSLIRRSIAENDHTVVSIFVNPTQFGPNEDLETYPRTIEDDAAQLKRLGVECLFAPKSSGEIYPLGLQRGPFVDVDLGWATKGLEARTRPGFFKGVATVVAKLLLLVRPGTAYFGQKDWQQLTVVKALCEGLFLNVKIESVETARDPNGLALSSRNSYLEPSARLAASDIYKGLLKAAASARLGMAKSSLFEPIEQLWHQHVLDGRFKIDYLELCTRNLEPIEAVCNSCVVLCAVYVHGVRLIDNILITV